MVAHDSQGPKLKGGHNHDSNSRLCRAQNNNGPQRLSAETSLVQYKREPGLKQQDIIATK